MFNYAATAETAARLITKFGQTGYVRRRTVTGGNPWDVDAGNRTDPGYLATLVVLPIKAQQVGQNIGDTALRQTDVQIYATADVGIVPRNDDQIVAGDRTFIVLRCNAIAPAGVTVAYDIIGRE